MNKLVAVKATKQDNMCIKAAVDVIRSVMARFHEANKKTNGTAPHMILQVNDTDAHESRITNSGINRVARGVFDETRASSLSRSSLAALAPIATASCLTVVSRGRSPWASMRSANPTTDRSLPIRSPATSAAA